jgi:muramoyltetrapeptide carboxypeptidase LdcA involved in peptidoglycan recycling
VLDDVRGIVFGTMPDCGPADELCATIEDCLGDLGVPIGFGAPVGHGPANRAVPLGVAARLRIEGTGAPDVEGGVLEGIEPLVA